MREATRKVAAGRFPSILKAAGTGDPAIKGSANPGAPEPSGGEGEVEKPPSER